MLWYQKTCIHNVHKFGLDRAQQILTKKNLHRGSNTSTYTASGFTRLCSLSIAAGTRAFFGRLSRLCGRSCGGIPSCRHLFLGGLRCLFLRRLSWCSLVGVFLLKTCWRRSEPGGYLHLFSALAVWFAFSAPRPKQTAMIVSFVNCSRT